MSGEARKLLKAALRLSVKERAAVAQSLIKSLDEGAGLDIDGAWAKEITRRVKDLDSGRAKLVPWSEVRRKLYTKIKPVAHDRC